MPVKRLLKWSLGWVYTARRGARRVIAAAGGARKRGEATASGSLAGPHRVPRGALDCFIAFNEHGAYCVPRSSQHRPVAQAIARGRVWESDTLDLLCATDRDADIIHAGTFFGDFIPALSRSRHGGGKVWAFEPGRENHRSTQVTVLLNDLENVALEHAGLGAEAAHALLATTGRDGVPLGGASRLVKDPARVRWSDNERVELVTVDEVVGSERRVGVVHFDVEGNEQEALAGALATITRCRPLIVLETLPDAEWLARELEPLGYRTRGTVNRNHVLRCD
jgi:FkbM family methyltransferase